MKKVRNRDIPYHYRRAPILAILGILAALVALTLLAPGCGGDTTTTAPVGTETTGAASTDTTAGGAIKTGGTLKVGMQAGN
ncbi:MAG: hypothetical protein MUQ56_02660, partial [Thermoleophilia bacterium]|nr:hypothetical protein [Thermoleophilia bacterium]